MNAPESALSLLRQPEMPLRVRLRLLNQIAHYAMTPEQRTIYETYRYAYRQFFRQQDRIDLATDA